MRQETKEEVKNNERKTFKRGRIPTEKAGKKTKKKIKDCGQSEIYQSHNILYFISYINRRNYF